MKKRKQKQKLYNQGEVKELLANSQASMRAQIGAIMSGRYDESDTLHNVYLDYGYPDLIEFEQYLNMYRRFGLASRACNIYPQQTWLDDPIIVSDSEQFKNAIAEIVEGHGLWKRVESLDLSQRIGQYAGIFMRVRDGKKPEKPLASVSNGVGSLQSLVVLYQNQLEVQETQKDVMADDFGMPTMYKFHDHAGISGGNMINIHPSRIIISSEGSTNGSIYGVSTLECIYNSLMDLRKIIGAGGEGFYKNAAQSIVYELKDVASANANVELLKKFNEQSDDFLKNRMRRSMWTPGMEAKTLDSTLANPEQIFMNALRDISAGSGVPTSLLIGSQEGRLAGDKDNMAFLGQVQARRTGFGTDTVRSVIGWLIKYGIVPTQPYSVEWPDAQAQSKNQKLDGALLMADINQKQLNAGDDLPFTSDEIRIQGGYLPEDEETPGA